MSISVYKQIADDLRRRISSGDLSPGADLPTEQDLADQWRTSRGPIRNALAELRQDGLIETTRGRPAKVVERRASQAVDVSIPFTRWAHQVGATPGADTRELSLRRASAAEAESLEISPRDYVVHVLRLRSLDDRPTMLERLTYIEEAGRTLFDIDPNAVSLTAHLEEQGFASVDVDHGIDAIAADEVDSELLEVEVGTPILRLLRVSRDQHGRVFESSDDRYRSDIVRFTVSAFGRATVPPSGD